MRQVNKKEIVVWMAIVFLGATFSFAQWKLRVFEREFRYDEQPVYMDDLRISALQDAADVFGVDLHKASESLVDAIIQIESGGDVRAVGKAGERGLMQIKERTWREVTEHLFGHSLPFSRAFDADMNRQVGKAYLADIQGFLYTHRDEWQADERSLLLACYNAGPGRVKQAGFDITRIPSFTQGYVERAIALHDFYLAEDAPQMRRILLAHQVSKPSVSGGVLQ